MGHICSHTLLHVHPQLTSKLLPEDIGTKHAYASHHRKSYHMDNCLLLSGSVFSLLEAEMATFGSGHCFRLALQSFLLSFCWVVSSVNIACYRERPLNIIWQAIVTDDGMISIWVCFICVICLSSLLSRVCVAVATSGVSCHGGGVGVGLVQNSLWHAVMTADGMIRCRSFLSLRRTAVGTCHSLGLFGLLWRWQSDNQVTSGSNGS